MTGVEAKKKIVIDNYFNEECYSCESIKEVFAKGFELGLKKVPTIIEADKEE